MSKQLLNKAMKVASVALLAGGMIGGAGFANNASANGKIKTAKVNHKVVRHAIKRSAKRNKKSNRRIVRRNTRVSKRAVARAVAKREALARAKRTTRHAYQPLNHKKYRHIVRRNVKRHYAFRRSAYYRNIWTRAEKINRNGIRKDEKAMRFDQKRGYKSAVKYLQGKINYLNGYVRHDEHMLSLRY